MTTVPVLVSLTYPYHVSEHQQVPWSPTDIYIVVQGLLSHHLTTGGHLRLVDDI